MYLYLLGFRLDANYSVELSLTYIIGLHFLIIALSPFSVFLSAISQLYIPSYYLTEMQIWDFLLNDDLVTLSITVSLKSHNTCHLILIYSVHPL